MIASVVAGGRCRHGPAQGRTAFFLNRSPSRRRNSQTALCETFTPRAASSSFSPCSVRCGVWPIRSRMKARCGSSTGLRCPPILPGATEPVARALRPLHHRRHRNTEPRRHRAAALPADTAATTRSRRSLERGRAIRCWPPIPASILNHNPSPNGIPPNSNQSVKRSSDVWDRTALPPKADQ